MILRRQSMSGGEKAVGKLFEEGKGYIMQDTKGKLWIFGLWLKGNLKVLIVLIKEGSNQM